MEDAEPELADPRFAMPRHRRQFSRRLLTLGSLLMLKRFDDAGRELDRLDDQAADIPFDGSPPPDWFLETIAELRPMLARRDAPAAVALITRESFGRDHRDERAAYAFTTENKHV